MILDLYDLGFICKEYFNDLSPTTKNALIEAFSYKGLEQFDYIISNQKDELIDNSKMLDNFLTAWDNLGLLKDSNDVSTLENIEKEIWVNPHYRDGHFVSGHYRKKSN